MTLDLPAIRARAEAATPGPWSLQESNQGGAILLRGLENDNRLRRHPQSHLQVVPEADAVFVAHAREDVPALLAEVERLREALREARRVLVDVTELDEACGAMCCGVEEGHPCLLHMIAEALEATRG